jgi:hypothetical protein
MRAKVKHLVDLGRMPPESASEEEIQKFDDAIQALPEPLTDDEASALVGVFGDEDTFGMAQTLHNIIETAPGWPIDDALSNDSNPFVRELKERAAAPRVD